MKSVTVEAVKCQECGKLHDLTSDEYASVEAVKCQECGKLHELTSEDYASVHGNICRGMGGGLVGNNLDKERKVEQVSIYCFPYCLSKVLGISTVSTRDKKAVDRADPFGIKDFSHPADISEQRRSDFGVPHTLFAR